MYRLLRRSAYCFTGYRPLQTETVALRKQLTFRACNLGVRELDLIIGHWAKQNLSKFEQTDLQLFNIQVLQHQTPQLLKKILGQAQISNDEQMILKIREFALDSSVSKIDNT